MCSESFHVVSWATEVLDEVRREVWNGARRSGVRSHAADLTWNHRADKPLRA
jgi:transposase